MIGYVSTRAALLLTARVRSPEAQFDLANQHSWASRQQSYAEETRKEQERLRSSLDEVRATNQADHEQLARETQHAVAQLTTDGQVLEHVREITRFFKSA